MSNPDSSSLIELTADQKAIALEHCKLKLSEITVKVFPGAKPDGRTTEGKSIKAFLAGMGKETEPPVPVAVVLSDSQKKMVDDLMRAGRVKSSLEMAKLVWSNDKVKNLSSEWRVVFTYMNEVYPDSFTANSEAPVMEAIYTPPPTLASLIGMVNTYVVTGDARKTYNGNSLKISEERNLKALMSYLRVYRFKYVASTYEKEVDRSLFVSTFVRWTHNKPDLTEMEQDQMISAASETVNIAQMEREIQEIKRYHESIMQGDEVDEATGKKKRYGMTEVEQINGLRTKHDQAKGRLKTLMEGLEEVRAKRLNERDARSNSVLNLLDAWRDDPEWREDILGVGTREKEEDRAEVKRLRSMDDVIALITGQSEEEAGA